jgi:hypothetical protein
LKNATDDIIESLVCPPPPSDREAINEDVISSLIVPAPGQSTPNFGQSVLYEFNESPEFSQTDSELPPIPIFTNRCFIDCPFCRGEYFTFINCTMHCRKTPDKKLVNSYIET